MSSSEELRTGHEAGALAEQARVLADSVIAEDAVDRVPDEAIQRLMAAAVKLYAAKMEDGARFSPFAAGDVTATEVAVAATGMLKAVEMEVFELGMWQVWGRS